MIIDGTTYIKGGKYTNVVSYSSIARICNKGSLYISGGEFKNDCSGGGDLVCFDTYVDDPASGKNLYLSGTLTLTNAAVIALGNKNDRIYLNGDVGNSFRIREMQSSLFAAGVQVLYNAGTTDYVSRNFSKFTGNSMDSKNWLVDSTGKLVAN